MAIYDCVFCRTQDAEQQDVSNTHSTEILQKLLKEVTEKNKQLTVEINKVKEENYILVGSNKQLHEKVEELQGNVKKQFNTIEDMPKTFA